MADLTAEQAITVAWTEITAPLSLADDTTYLIDVNGQDSPAVVYSAETDSATPAPTVAGHPWKPTSAGSRRVNSRTYKKRTGVFLWARCSRGTATLEVSAVE